MDLGTFAIVALIAGLAGGAVGSVAIGALQAWMSRRKRQWVSHVTPRGPLPVVRPATPSGQGGVGPFDRFNESGKRVLSLAQDEAIRQNHNYIGTEHLLAGMLRDGDTLAARALQSFGIELTKVRTALELIIGRGDRTTSPSEITLSPRTKKVIELAIDESRRMGQTYVGTEHILLGIVTRGRGHRIRNHRVPRRHPSNGAHPVA